MSAYIQGSDELLESIIETFLNPLFDEEPENGTSLDSCLLFPDGETFSDIVSFSELSCEGSRVLPLSSSLFSDEVSPEILSRFSVALFV